jgi:hypothetical protein
MERLAAYEAGYRDRLRIALDGALTVRRRASPIMLSDPADLRTHPVYQEGFSEGLRDGEKILEEIYTRRQARQEVTRSAEQLRKEK